MEMIQGIRPTSKASLKLQCLWVSNGDVDKARKLYDFFAEDVDLPDNDPAPQSWVVSARDVANGFVSWFRENQETLAQGLDFIRNMAGRGVPMTESQPLPEINE